MPDPVSATAGAAVVGGAGSYFGAKEQADARRDAAKRANAPWRQKAPYLDDLYGMAQDQAKDPNYQQQFQEQAPQALQSGVQAQQGLANQLMGQNYGQGVQDYGQNLLSGQYLPGGEQENPALQSAMDAVRQESNENLQENILPETTGQSAQVGQLGSSRQGVIQANAIDDTQQNISNELARMQLQAYESERQRQMQAPNVMQQGATMQAAPIEMLQSAGQTQMDVPRQTLQQYGQLLGVGPTASPQAAQPGPSPTQSAISGTLGGASTAAGIYNAFSQSGGGGTSPAVNSALSTSMGNTISSAQSYGTGYV